MKNAMNALRRVGLMMMIKTKMMTTEKGDGPADMNLAAKEIGRIIPKIEAAMTVLRIDIIAIMRGVMRKSVLITRPAVNTAMIKMIAMAD